MWYAEERLVGLIFKPVDFDNEFSIALRRDLKG